VNAYFEVVPIKHVFTLFKLLCSQ